MVKINEFLIYKLIFLVENKLIFLVLFSQNNEDLTTYFQLFSILNLIIINSSLHFNHRITFAYTLIIYL